MRRLSPIEADSPPKDNLKLVLARADASAGAERHPARELGVNRYERLAGFDASAGERYWSNTAAFWSDIVIEIFREQSRSSDVFWRYM